MWERIIRKYGGTEEAELHIFGRQGKAEVQKRNFRPLEVPAEMKNAEEKLSIFGSPGRPEVLAERNFRSLAVKTERNCGSKA